MEIDPWVRMKKKKRQEQSKYQLLPAAWPNASHHVVTSDPEARLLL